MGPARTRAGRRGAVVLGAVGVLAVLATSGAGAQSSDPAWSVDEQALDASLDCPEFAHPEREPVLLVHGTFTAGHEQFDWNYLQVLPDLGYDVCVVTYPDRGFGDQQVSAEYVAHAILTMHEATGRPVDLVGHSQGAAMPRWAVKFWPSVRAALDDFVAIAGPHHGIRTSGGEESGGTPMPAAFFQFSPDSRFVTILNRDDETPGEVDWTNLYSEHDELVQPVEPEPTAALDHGQDDPRVANLLLQDLCPGRVVDHLTIGTTDRLAFDLVVDALSHDGPADPARLDLGPACSVADQVVEDPAQVTALPDLLRQGAERGMPDWHLTDEEPATRDYARDDRGGQDRRPDHAGRGEGPPDHAAGDASADGTTTATAGTAPAPTGVVGAAGSVLPATGGGATGIGGLLVLLVGMAGLRRRPR